MDKITDDGLFLTLIPICDTLQFFHEHNTTHGALSIDSIRYTPTGVPKLSLQCVESSKCKPQTADLINLSAVLLQLGTLRFIQVCNTNLRPRFSQMLGRNPRLLDLISTMENADQENLTARQLLDTDVVQKFGYAQRNCKGITMTGGCTSFVSAAMVRTLIKQHEQLKAIVKPEASDPNQTGSKPMIASGSSGSTEELRQPDSIKTRNKPYDRQLSIKYSGDDDEMKAFASRLEFGKSRKNKLQVIEKIRDAHGKIKEHVYNTSNAVGGVIYTYCKCCEPKKKSAQFESSKTSWTLIKGTSHV